VLLLARVLVLNLGPRIIADRRHELRVLEKRPVADDRQILDVIRKAVMRPIEGEPHDHRVARSEWMAEPVDDVVVDSIIEHAGRRPIE
jgi:hypothetical protein